MCLWIYSIIYAPGGSEVKDSGCKAGRISSVQFSSVAESCPTVCNPMNHSTPGLPAHHQLLEFTQTHAHRVSDAIQPSHPLLSSSLLPPIPPSIRVFSNESALHIRWPKYWSFSFSISPSNEHPGLISFRMDWLDLLAAQGTLKSVFQHHSSKASMQDTWVQSLGREDLLEKGLVAHSSILKFHGQWMEEPGWLQSMGSQRVGHNWATHTHTFVCII